MKVNIKKLIEESGLKDPQELDAAVLDAKAQETSDINNGGLEAQIKYLLKFNGITTQKKALEFIQGAKEESV